MEGAGAKECVSRGESHTTTPSVSLPTTAAAAVSVLTIGLCPSLLWHWLFIFVFLLTSSACLYWTLYFHSSTNQLGTDRFGSQQLGTERIGSLQVDSLLFILHWIALLTDLSFDSPLVTFLVTVLVLRALCPDKQWVIILCTITFIRRIGSLFLSSCFVHLFGLFGLLLAHLLVLKLVSKATSSLSSSCANSNEVKLRIRKHEVYARPIIGQVVEAEVKCEPVPSILLIGPEEADPLGVTLTQTSGQHPPPPPPPQHRHGPPVTTAAAERHKMRRTSLPAALPLSIQRPNLHHNTTGGVDTALLLEAHGLVTDMLLDSAALPAHIVAGLKALATLLTPPPPSLHYTNLSSRPRAAPLTLSTDPDYTSDIDEIPYTGEKISTMPKRNSAASKKGVSANLLRRMSTSTWTTTTSATGMPTLEPQPNARRRRSASFRSAMGTPGELDQSVMGKLGSFVMETGDVDDNCSTASTLGDAQGPEVSGSSGQSIRLSPVIFTVEEPKEEQGISSASTEDEGSSEIICALDGTRFDLAAIASDPCLCRLNEWDYPIFDLERSSDTQILSHMCYKVFLEVGLFEAFKIPIHEFINYFHALEMGYRDKPYHNRMHAADVLHGVYYLTSQPIPGFEMQLSDPETPSVSEMASHRAWFNVEESSYGIMGANFPALELMALYTAAAMHDYDHPGRTNAFLVTTHAPQAILYNDRSVLENHHAAAAWNLLLSSPACNFLKFLDKAEFKRFRYLVIEAILATDLKRHFEILAEFNSKANEEDSVGIDWNQEADRLLVMEMCIKLADINGPCKFHDIHVRWTYRIAEEFYEQGDEEAELGLPISPYMDRDHPQLAKLQESFINHLVAPLCKAVAEAGILPGFWEDEDEMEATGDELSSCQETDNDNDSSYSDETSEQALKKKRKIFCVQTKHLQNNHRHWMNVIKEETRKKEEGLVKTESVAISTDDAMETIEEENNTPHSLNRSFSFEKEDSKL